MNHIKLVTILDKALKVEFESGGSISFEDCWLRDNCRCAKCYHADTFQRSQHIIDIPEFDIFDIRYEKTQLIVRWEDHHQSEYSSDFLAQFDYESWKDSRRLKQILWRGNEVEEKVAKVHVDRFLNSNEDSKRVFKSLLDFGVALIEGVEPTTAATEEVCKALGGVQHTLFGGMWEFTTRADHADTAYTNLPLAVHNDNTYFTEAAGLQILHCLEHTNGSGGETVLVDGFCGALQLKLDYPEDFEFLSTFDVEAEYIEEGHHHIHSAPVIKVDKYGHFVQIRFNVYDRSAMAFKNSHECRSYYRSLRNLSRYYQDPSNQWKFKLTPGVVMVMDNFRVLHGRTAFTGNRRLSGSYVTRSDWLDKARTLKLIQ